MPTPSVRGRPNPSHGARGFTLVELVTAASIMTIVMIGVVEIFGIVTQTATDAEAMHGAYQQMRATLDRLNRDLRGITPEGYLKITNTTPTGGVINYHSDALAFVSVGRYSGAYDPQNCRAGAAEILYTTNVTTPDAFLKIGTNTLDYRRGVLARSAWLMGGQSDTSAAEDQDKAKASYLGELFGSPAKARPVGPTKVWPLLAGQAPVASNDSMRRIMTTGTSEFFVEYWDGTNWQYPPQGTTTTFSPGSERPRAVRVTLAVHGPDDRGPLPAGKNRYEGYALQEAFWLGNP